MKWLRPLRHSWGPTSSAISRNNILMQHYKTSKLIQKKKIHGEESVKKWMQEIHNECSKSVIRNIRLLNKGRGSIAEGFLFFFFLPQILTWFTSAPWLILSLFKIFKVCSSWLFCIPFGFVKYYIQIVFILMTEFFGSSFLSVWKADTSLPSP